MRGTHEAPLTRRLGRHLVFSPVQPFPGGLRQPPPVVACDPNYENMVIGIDVGREPIPDLTRVHVGIHEPSGPEVMPTRAAAADRVVEWPIVSPWALQVVIE